MTQRSLTWAPEPPRFFADMTCCKPARVLVGLSCKRPYQQCCAWHHIRLVVRHRGEKALVQFADHLLSVCGWTLGEVFFSFNAAREISSLAIVCARRWRAIPSAADRAAYRNQICADTSPEFVATFDVLCEADAGPQ
ncbi:hypothetical protein [Ralstonia pseudosolanacearum]|uniref:Uncharacterized protein n=1 Tax=Ralstonia phage Dina TaxID=2759732 RepID=A0A7G5B9D4_9CAUD|nr:hypothetical protein [Ralstonia pseudosolanacearum]YP_010082056.1 hypothetical protein KMD15_gp17 [Ralstonia phage Dina]MCL1619485.1 hypothetical protein [Ralstonia pseudosolanacearum CaRs-Mep]MCQ4680972.1 hypothetical protein [Ralstonia pseudosolanacearum]QMV32907.1 hypothetical protein 2CaD_00017 [Ralstonia phage Dina]